MSIEDRRIYLIYQGTPAWDHHEAYRKANAEKHAATVKLCRKMKARYTTWWGDSDGNVGGLLYTSMDEVPGVRKKQEGDCIVGKPDKRTKEGRAFAKEIERINKLANFRITAMGFFEGQTDRMTGGPGRFYMVRVQFGSIGDIKNRNIVVTIHKDSKAKPIDGLKEIKLSKFFELQGK